MRAALCAADLDFEMIHAPEASGDFMLNSALRNVGGLLAVLFLVTFLSGSPALAQSDEFSTTSLSSFWFWIREDPTHWSLKTRPGYLRIVTQKGDISTTLAYNAQNILLQGTSSGDFVLTTRVRIFPSYDYQQGGLIAYVNDDNYVKLVRSHILSTGGGMVELVSEVNAKMSWLRLRLLDQDVWLRLTLSGTTFTGDYSLSGKPAEWFGVGSLKASFTAPKVGLMAINGMLPDVPELPVDFDFFQATGTAVGNVAPQVVGTPRVGQQVFVDLAAEPDLFYYMGAAFDTVPGMQLGTRNLPLNPDPLLVLSVNNLLPGVFNHFNGYLNARGEGRAWIRIPGDTGLVGQSFHVAFVTLNAAKPFGISTISRATKVQIQS
jgi:regulation of enolase protein 1 (concanavalin A-like superfamily)